MSLRLKFFLLLFFGLVSSLGMAQPLVDAYGAIIRGDTTRKEIALVFTGDEFADGGELIRNVLAEHKIKASFFLTGNFLYNEEFRSLVRSLKKDGHYMGPHSDKHVLYASWTKRDSLLVSHDDFMADLLVNYEKLRHFGIKKQDAVFFIPPFEWYNAKIVMWSKEIGSVVVNFTSGTRSTADYTYPEMGKSYRSSEEIYNSIVQYEENDPTGLNGFILLLHVGTDPRRTDKFYAKLDDLLTELESRGYNFLRIDALLKNINTN